MKRIHLSKLTFDRRRSTNPIPKILKVTSNLLQFSTDLQKVVFVRCSNDSLEKTWF